MKLIPNQFVAIACAFLALAPLLPPAAAHDPHPASSSGDPLPAVADHLACGFPAVRSVVNETRDTLQKNGVPAFTGSCVDGKQDDYVNPIITPVACQAPCAARKLLPDLALPIATPIAIHQDPIPLLPQDVEPVTIATPGARQDVATLETYRNGELYCIVVTTAQGQSVPQCVDLDGLTPLLPATKQEFVNVPSQNVATTPGFQKGALGSTPAIHFDEGVVATLFLNSSIRFDASRMNPRLEGTVQVCEPIDFDDASEDKWWIKNGNVTTLDLRFTLVRGSTAKEVELHLPYLGQLVAALLKTSAFGTGIPVAGWDEPCKTG